MKVAGILNKQLHEYDMPVQVQLFGAKLHYNRNKNGQQNPMKGCKVMDI